VPVSQAQRTLAAPIEAIWRVVEDPHHMPRWWPGVTRIEGVEADRFTQVFVTRRGKPVRADFRIVESEPPWRLTWEQELAGTPFERVLNKLVTEIVLEQVPEGTLVTLAESQKLRGYSRTGGFLMRRATNTKLVEALEALERACV
jgi:uncharacterized protein YndB with AHSA1/START domain